MKKLFAAVMLSAFTLGSFAVIAHPMQQDTSKKHKMNKDTSMKKDTTKKPVKK